MRKLEIIVLIIALLFVALFAIYSISNTSFGGGHAEDAYIYVNSNGQTRSCWTIWSQASELGYSFQKHGAQPAHLIEDCNKHEQTN